MIFSKINFPIKDIREDIDAIIFHLLIKMKLLYINIIIIRYLLSLIKRKVVLFMYLQTTVTDLPFQLIIDRKSISEWTTDNILMIRLDGINNSSDRKQC